MDISREHLHPYGSFFMCYEKNKWEDARDAIIKSSIAVPKYCLKPKYLENVDKYIENFDIDELPESFEHPIEKGKRIQINRDTLTYDF